MGAATNVSPCRAPARQRLTRMNDRGCLNEASCARRCATVAASSKFADPPRHTPPAPRAPIGRPRQPLRARRVVRSALDPTRINIEAAEMMRRCAALQRIAVGRTHPRCRRCEPTAAPRRGSGGTPPVTRADVRPTHSSPAVPSAGRRLDRRFSRRRASGRPISQRRSPA